jgi:hypothetical protein
MPFVWKKRCWVRCITTCQSLPGQASLHHVLSVLRKPYQSVHLAIAPASSFTSTRGAVGPWSMRLGAMVSCQSNLPT